MSLSLRNEIRTRTDELTAAERKISAALLADYPFAGLVPIQELAERARASPPSVMRFVGKLGCSGYLDFQRRLIEELKEGGRSPIDLRATQDLKASDDDLQGLRRAPLFAHPGGNVRRSKGRVRRDLRPARRRHAETSSSSADA